MAEVKLDNLIEKIRKEGVEGAQQQSDEIIEKAKKEADDIIANAKKEAEEIVSTGKSEAEQFQANAELAIQQAARDGERMFKTRLNDLFDSVFKREVSAAIDAEALKNMIVSLVEKWAENPQVDIEVNDADRKKLEDLLFASLKKDLKDGITIKAGKDVGAGFRIGLKGENVYYDFTDESIAAILKSSLNPRLNEILGKQNG